MVINSLKKSVLTTLVVVLFAGHAWAQSGDYRYETAIYDDGQGNNINSPEGVACDGDRIVVADTGNSRLLLYTMVNGVADLEGEIKVVRQVRPTFVQMGADGRLLVYDSRAKEILRFDSAGNRAGKVEPSGVPTGSPVIPKSFRTDSSGNIYLLDIFGRRVVVLDESDAFVRQIDFPEAFGFFSDLAVTAAGTVLIVDSVQSGVFAAAPGQDVFSPLSDDMRDHFSYATRMEVDSGGLVYVVDEETSTIAVLRRDGSFMDSLFNRGRKEGLLYYPSQICVGDGSRITIADRDNNRVQVFREKE